MRSEQLKSKDYDTDKYAYLRIYDLMFSKSANENINLLELGVFKGGSLLMWHDYFPNGNIVGVDIKLPRDFPITNRIKLYEGSQTDLEFLTNVSRESAPNGFDIIIDDASHMGVLSKISFWHLFDNFLKPGGLYVIEDWGTGYWDNWPDGKALDLDNYQMFDRNEEVTKTPFAGHNYGMVGFIKQLVDEVAASDITKFQTSTYTRNSRFENITIYPYVVFITKKR